MIEALRLVLIVLLLNLSHAIIPRARARVLANSETRSLSSFDEIVASSNISIAATTSLNVSAGQLICFEPEEGRPVVTIDDCRSTLREIVNRPNKRLIQTFQMLKKPKDPHPPPYGFHIARANCVVEVFAVSLRVEDRFSWVQVKDLAQNILQNCKDAGKGFGGRAEIGQINTGWWVVVQGDPNPGESDDTWSSELTALTNQTQYQDEVS